MDATVLIKNIRTNSDHYEYIHMSGIYLYDLVVFVIFETTFQL